jgi:hypothetical protein
MADKPQKPVAKLTTKQAIERLFPKPVVEQVKREIDQADRTSQPSMRKQ